MEPKNKLNLRLENGKIVVPVKEGTKGVSIVVDSKSFIDELAALIPGTIDDAIFDILRAAFSGPAPRKKRTAKKAAK